MKAARAGFSLASLFLLTATGCSELKPAHELGACWNVNTASAGPVQGQGVLITSMEGMALVAPGCDDHDGPNRYELSRDASDSLDAVLTKQPRFITFRFSGHILPRSGHHSLWIGDLKNVAVSAKAPGWSKFP